MIEPLAAWFSAMTPEQQVNLFGIVMAVLHVIAVAWIIVQILDGLSRPRS